MEVSGMSHRDFHIWKLYQIWKDFSIWKLRRRYYYYITPPFLQKSFFTMAAAMCQALPSFYSGYNNKSLFICVSNEIYEKYIETQKYCVSTHDSILSVL